MVSQELGVHSSGGNVLGTLLLLDAVGVSLVRVVVRAGVLLLLGSRRGMKGRTQRVRCYVLIYVISAHSSRRRSSIGPPAQKETASNPT